ncbi:hypothetical protein MHYP_G00236710 [Metynnis hypsauchen]
MKHEKDPPLTSVQACSSPPQALALIMKTLLVTLLLAMLLMSGSALKCNRCVPRPGGRCTNTKETCSFNQNACVSGTFTKFPFTHFKRCTSLSDCLIMQATPTINARCCQTDLCN